MKLYYLRKEPEINQTEEIIKKQYSRFRTKLHEVEQEKINLQDLKKKIIDLETDRSKLEEDKNY
jgi:hypothetical protein